MRLACITGASSGIGEEFARQLAARHYSLILVARSLNRLNALAEHLRNAHGIECEVIACDLSVEEECMRLADILHQRDLYLLINNAGFGDIGLFTETSAEKEIEMINVNIKALHLLTKEVLRDLVDKDRGYILNVASIAGLLDGGPWMAAYYATKAYVASLTTSIAEELRATASQVHICALCPGPVNTHFNDVAGVRFALKGMTAQACVSAALSGMNRGRLIIVPGFFTKLSAIAAHFAPRRLQTFITARVQRSKV